MMDNTTKAATTTTLGPDGRSSDDDTTWLDVVLPIMGIGFLIILVVTVYKYCVEVCLGRNSSCCFKRRSNRTQVRTVSGMDNRDFESNVEDRPPSYSVAGIGRSDVELFRVVADDVSDCPAQWPPADSEILEKLPSYTEIMEEKRREVEHSNASSLVIRRTRSAEIASQSNDTAEVNAMSSPHSPVQQNRSEEERSISRGHLSISDADSHSPPPYRPPSA